MNYNTDRQINLTDEQKETLTQLAINVQLARKHLDQFTTKDIAKVMGISKQALQMKINTRLRRAK